MKLSTVLYGTGTFGLPPIILIAVAGWPYPVTSRPLAVIVTACIMALGWGAVTFTAHRLHSPQIRYLFPLFLVKLALTLGILAWSWMPVFDHEWHAANNFDASRFHYYAATLAAHNFHPDSVTPQNYTGAIWYYAAIYWLLGPNQLFPALVNALGSLMIGLMLVHIWAETHSPQRAWLCGLYMVLPDALFWDVMTLKDVLSTLLVVVIHYLVFRWHRSGSLLWPLLLLPCWTLLAAVRVPMALISLALTGLVLWRDAHRQRHRVMLATACALGALSLFMLFPVMGSLSGSYQADLVQTAQTALVLSAVGEHGLDSDTVQWSDQSIGKRMIPASLWEAILFAPIRSAFYLIAPLPNVTVSWQRGVENGALFTQATALLLVAGFAPILASLVSRRIRHSRVFTWLGLPLFVLLLSIGSAVWVIHPRYRLVVLPFVIPVLLMGSDARLTKPLLILSPVIALSGTVLYLWLKS